MTNDPKSILITGASSGIGAALAEEYSNTGITLFLQGRNLERLEQVANKCRARRALVYTHIVDIRDREAMSSWINNICKETMIDLIIANAGVSGGTLQSMESEEQTRQIFAANLDGTLNTLLPAITMMQKHQHGQIAIMSSLAGYRGLPSCPAYSASKAAVRIYGEALRGLLAKDGIGVTVITPGYIKTPMTKVNNFYMPMLMDAQKAARIIKTKLSKNPARIAFPWPFYLCVWFLSCLPPGLTDWVFKNLPGKPAIDDN